MTTDKAALERHKYDVLVIGAGGAGSSSPSINGTNGADTSITINGISFIAKGGGGGGTVPAETILAGKITTEAQRRIRFA